MSISAMKCALQSLESVEKVKGWNKDSIVGRHCTQSAHFLRQAIAEAEKQEPAFYVIQATDRFGEGYEQTYWQDPAGFPVYTRPVHASDISQEPVDETAKDRHELAGTIPISNGGIATRTPSSFISPPQREWVGLTDKEVTSIIREWHWMPYELCKVIEAKLKEKNT